ncbi:MAG: bifunctional transaldolase/phosoglucose isomerase [Candidatus Acidiferrales bacterium]|jgi:transaldolase/glucose-6-phosphate isomerase
MASTVSSDAAAGPRGTANPLRLAEAQGQAVWLDYIRRTLLTSGDLKRLVDNDGLSGMTSNPTIFEKAIAGSADYDETLRKLIDRNPNADAPSLFDSLAIEDIRMATDILRPVFDRTNGADGFVSLEVSPKLARDTAGTIREARRLWGAVQRPNVMIKVPATPEGIPAVEELLASGINVNITLMFSMGHYEAVARAYIRGLTRAVDPARIASVASFFVSRVDNLIDPALDKIGTPEALALRGKAGIANCRLVYKRFQEIFDGPDFAALRAKGARVQRVLWASTSTKNPAYPDTLYVAELIGPHTVNTLPPATLDAFRDHGVVRGSTILDSPDGAAAEIAELARLGVSLDEVTHKLQVDGVASFAKSFEDLMAALDKKKTALVTANAGKAATAGAGANVGKEEQSLGPLAPAVEQRLAAWAGSQFSKRLWAKDPTLWAPAGTPEITDRLGWLTLPDVQRAQVAELVKFREDIKAEGFTHAVVLGMGGSSLAPEVFEKTFGSRDGYPVLHVLDSTHPAAITALEDSIDLRHTLFIVSSKSGTTTEPNSFFYYFWRRVSDHERSAGRHFIAITDPGTPLQILAEQRDFRRVFLATPDVGGRYSALTHFGLVPAAIIGLDLQRFLDRAFAMQQASAANVAEQANPGLQLGAIIGEAAKAGRDKVTFFASPSLRHLPVWLEQLIAESTGKEGKGIIPVADEEPAGDPSRYGSDRLFVHLRLASEKDDVHTAKLRALEVAGHPIVRITTNDLFDLGGEFYRWEIAIAAAGAVIGIQPFNQPDVQLAKDLARQAMKKTPGDGAGKVAASDAIDASDSAALRAAVQTLLASVKPGDYIGIDAYIAPSDRTTAALERIRTLLWHRSKAATMLGYGPRFLHSTGQLHKGGPNTGLFIQILDTPVADLSVPETDYTFGTLIRAQAQGDYTALQQRGRRLLQVQLGRDAAAGLARLEEVLRV